MTIDDDGTVRLTKRPEILRQELCVNALAGLNPAGIPTLIDAVERIVGMLNAAKIQHGGEDRTNILSTLEGALRGCKPLTPDAPAP